jgi:hypothetical protein
MAENYLRTKDVDFLYAENYLRKRNVNFLYADLSMLKFDEYFQLLFNVYRVSDVRQIVVLMWLKLLLQR